MRLFLLFLAVPLIEIALFVQIGGVIGLGWTLLTVVATAIIGTSLVRSQGLRTLAELRGAVDGLRDPTGPLLHGAMILFSGALLLTPGFFTDAIGFLLLVPAVREAVYRRLRDRVVIHGAAAPRPAEPSGAPEIIDGDWEEIDPNAGPNPRPTHRSPSGWTRH